ncbi:MAG: hypothetical protein ACE5FI_06980 [Anaerolineales bacterium]
MLLNAHTQLELGGFAHLRPGPDGELFVPWREKIIRARRVCRTAAVGGISAAGESVARPCERTADSVH